ncbi:MAG: hypothetical protein ACKPKO_41035, partial [Candidatus Fonsibacter sp.]
LPLRLPKCNRATSSCAYLEVHIHPAGSLVIIINRQILLDLWVATLLSQNCGFDRPIPKLVN